MKFENNCKVFDLKKGVTMLAFIEFDGDDSILHMVVWPEGLSIDIKLSGPADTIFESFTKLDVESAQGIYDEQLSGVIELLEADEDG